MIVIFSPTFMTKARYCSLFMIGIKANFLFDSNETINKYIATFKRSQTPYNIKREIPSNL